MSPDSKQRGTTPTLTEKNNLETKFLNATITSNLKQVLACLKAGVDVNAYIGGTHNALHIAAEGGDVGLATALARSPDLNYNLKTEFGNTPLIMAIVIRKRKFVQFLLKNGADPNLTDPFGRSPFHHVCRFDAIDLAFDLMKYNADINVEDTYGNTPLIISLLHLNSLPMGKLLVKHGADIDPPTKRSLPLFLDYVLNCRTPNQIEGIEFLVNNGVNVNMRELLTGRTALHFVGLTGYLPLARLLLKWGVDKTSVDVLGKTAADIADRHLNDEVYELLTYGSVLSRNGSVSTVSVETR